MAIWHDRAGNYFTGEHGTNPIDSAAIVVERNRRMMQLAEHNGFPIVTRSIEGGRQLWYVPRELIGMVGCMAAVVA